MIRRAACICLILTILAAPAGAAALTLPEALARARESLPSYQAAKKRVASAEALYGASLGPYLPSLDASAVRERHDADGKITA